MPLLEENNLQGISESRWEAVRLGDWGAPSPTTVRSKNGHQHLGAENLKKRNRLETTENKRLWSAVILVALADDNNNNIILIRSFEAFRYAWVISSRRSGRGLNFIIYYLFFIFLSSSPLFFFKTRVFGRGLSRCDRVSRRTRVALTFFVHPLRSHTTRVSYCTQRLPRQRRPRTIVFE